MVDECACANPLGLSCSHRLLVGVYALGMGIVGWCGRRPVGWPARMLLIAAALSLIKPGLLTDLFGFSAIAVVMILVELHGRRQAARSASQ